MAEEITDDDLEQAILTSATGPARASGDSGSVEQHSLRDQLELLKYKRELDATSTARRGLGIRFHKLIPPGSD